MGQLRKTILKCFGDIWVLLKDNGSKGLGSTERSDCDSCTFLRIGDDVLVDAPKMSKGPKQIIISSDTIVTGFNDKTEELPLSNILPDGVVYSSDLATPM